MGRKVIWTHHALREQRSIFDYWNRRNEHPSYSIRLRKNIRDQVLLLRLQPFVGNFTEEFAVHRKLIAAHYLLFYRFTATELLILSIWDTRRDPAQAPYSY